MSEEEAGRKGAEKGNESRERYSERGGETDRDRERHQKGEVRVGDGYIG